MWRKRKVRISVRMWAPSTSASVMMMSLWYRARVISKSSSMPVPIAVIMAWISVLESTLSMRAFSTLMILPRRGRIAWKLDWRAMIAEPPAESPSTRKSSVLAGSRSEQSASLPGRLVESITPLRRARSRALRAASRACEALIALPQIARASAGCSSMYSASRCVAAWLTKPVISELPSFVFVWPSNCGSRSLTEMIAVSPSRVSGPSRFSSFSFSSPLARA